ncbi:DnaT-like ssDNA-binding protein [Cupriavidus sp.]|uniref:DnaT-like ssDNA-binding protein n=1 Tax=Cupriavidus sp. TaxID=1873897 RepID=UPI003D0CB432
MAIDTNPGSQTADSFVSVAEADAYHAKRGNSAWAAAVTATKEGALVRASGFVDAEYAWKGIRRTSTQALSWPRYDVVLDGYPLLPDIIPARVKDAVCELALKALAGDIAPDVLPDVVIETTVGPITKKYAPAKQNGGQKRYAYVDSLLGPLVSGGSGQIKLVRG